MISVVRPVQQEKLPRGENKNVVSFIGYAPQENPEIMIYVVIDERMLRISQRPAA